MNWRQRQDRNPPCRPRTCRLDIAKCDIKFRSRGCAQTAVGVHGIWGGDGRERPAKRASRSEAKTRTDPLAGKGRGTLARVGRCCSRPKNASTNSSITARTAKRTSSGHALRAAPIGPDIRQEGQSGPLNGMRAIEEWGQGARQLKTDRDADTQGLTAGAGCPPFERGCHASLP